MGTSTLLLAALVLQAPPNWETRMQRVLPQPGEERWLEVPWQLDLLEARHLAKETGRPIFLWTMNGHPMGCT
jgi:hypothetical protein